MLVFTCTKVSALIVLFRSSVESEEEMMFAHCTDGESEAQRALAPGPALSCTQSVAKERLNPHLPGCSEPVSSPAPGWSSGRMVH